MNESLVRGVFKVAVGFVVATLVVLAGALYASKHYLTQQQQLAAAGETRAAIEAGRLSSRLNPYDSEPLVAQSNLLAARGDREEALELLKEATSRDPASYLNYALLGNFYLSEMDDPEKAIEAYRRALELVPNATNVRSVYATALARSGEVEAAKKEYRVLAESGRSTLQDSYNLGRIQARTDEPDAALRTLREARETARERADKSEGQRKNQVEIFLQSVDLAIADAHVVKGDYASAIEELDQSESPQAPAILELLRTDPEKYRQTVLDSEI